VKVYSVFAKEQVEGLPQDRVYALEPPEDGEEKALELMNGTGAKFVYGGDKAYYSPHRDEIHLPPYGSFSDDAGFYGTALHELSHWGGHKDRLNRIYGKRFGDKAYQAEELTAELSSAFLCARLGIPATFRSAQYLQAWIEIMEADHRAIFSAASYASQSANYLWEKGFHEVNEQTPEVEAQGLVAA
jgi:antirestriction protein ArdC